MKMIQLILSIFIFVNPCLAAFECIDDATAKIVVSSTDNCHESTPSENHEDSSQANTDDTDHCSTHCTHTALFNESVSIHTNVNLSPKFAFTKFLYRNPTVESLKRPPISA